VRLLLIGLLAGFFSALFGVGGGVVIVPLLLFLGGFELRNATATSLGAIAITAAAGVVTYAVHGDVEPVYAALVGVPATAGVLAGTTIQQRVPVHTLSYLFAALLTAIAVRMLIA
jgi:uncharacterized protein